MVVVVVAYVQCLQPGITLGASRIAGDDVSAGSGPPTRPLASGLSYALARWPGYPYAGW